MTTRPGDNSHSHHINAANNTTSKSELRTSNFELRGPLAASSALRRLAAFIAIALVATAVCVRAFRVEASSAPASAAKSARIRWASPSFRGVMSTSNISGPLAAYLAPMPVLGTCDTAGPIEIESTTGTAAGVPTAYATLGLAVTAINAGVLHTGTINIEICAATVSEGTGTALLNASGSGSLKIMRRVAPASTGQTAPGVLAGDPTVVYFF